MMKKFEKELNEDKFEENFAKLDTNQDGKIAFNELFDSLVEKARVAGVLQE